MHLNIATKRAFLLFVFCLVVNVTPANKPIFGPPPATDDQKSYVTILFVVMGLCLYLLIFHFINSAASQLIDEALGKYYESMGRDVFFDEDEDKVEDDEDDDAGDGDDEDEDDGDKDDTMAGNVSPDADKPIFGRAPTETDENKS